MHSTLALEQFAPETFRFYRDAIDVIRRSGIPFLLGGAYAFGHYTGITRHTKDLDVFVKAADVPAVLDLYRKAGYRADLFFSHWLAKVFHADDFVDVIFNSGNGVCPVDDSWFEDAVDAEVLGLPVRLMSAENMIWQKAYIQERERFDGADVAHLIRARGRQLDWDRLLKRFDSHWRVLLAHLLLFGFIYPGDGDSVPPGVVAKLAARIGEPPAQPHTPPVCQGTLLSRSQYVVDVEEWGYADARQRPIGTMTEEQVGKWTDAGR